MNILITRRDFIIIAILEGVLFGACLSLALYAFAATNRNAESIEQVKKEINMMWNEMDQGKTAALLPPPTIN